MEEDAIVASEVTDKEELDQEVLDAIEDIGGPKGELTEPKEVETLESEETTEDATEEATEEVEDGVAEDAIETADEAPEVTEEKDETGVYKEPTTKDPGEFTAAVEPFEIKLTDGTTHKIGSLEDAENFAAKLDENPELISASQFLAFNRNVTKMDTSIESARLAYEQQKAQFDQEQGQVETRNQTIGQWDKEIKYLRDRGDLPKITDEQNTANWGDPEVAKQAGVKETLELFKWMEQENTKRIDAGLDPMRSMLDAHNAMQLDTMRTQETETVNRETTMRQKRGSLVGKASPQLPSVNTKGSIVGEGGSLDDLLYDFTNQ